MDEKQKGFSFGGATFSRTSPPVEKLTAETKILNVVLPFEEALKLSVAMQACVRPPPPFQNNRGRNSPRV